MAESFSSTNTNTFEPGLYTKSAFAPLPVFSRDQHVSVIGAGAFGGWTALHLQRLGYQVTLIDAWGAGNSRSSSGDETRVIRSTYGKSELYFKMNVRSLELWKEHQTKFNRQIFHNSGVLWFCYNDKSPLIDDSIPYSEKYGMRYEYLSNESLLKKFPFINTSDLHHSYLDPFGGYLKAREACDEVKSLFIKEGGKYNQVFVQPGEIHSKRLQGLITSSGNKITSDFYIFACGAWLPFLFPEVLKEKILCTKQAVFYFGTPQDNSIVYDSLPAWIDLDGDYFYYGISGNSSRGFKIGVDKRGVPFDPTNDERTVDNDVLLKAKAFLSHRFPELTNAPLIESRICPYENSVTGNFIFDVHPEAENIFFLGGGSGHGFKHSPALGELVANSIDGRNSIPDLFRIF